MLSFFTSFSGKGKKSFLLQVAAWVVKNRANPDISLDELRRKYIGRSPPIPAPVSKSLHKICNIELKNIAENTVITLVPKNQKKPNHIVYLHGGAFVNTLLKAHWDIIESLVEFTGSSVTVHLYPLAPEHQYMETFAFLTQVYKDILARTSPCHIVFCGDSAGGNLALSHCLNLRDRNVPSFTGVS